MNHHSLKTFALALLLAFAGPGVFAQGRLLFSNNTVTGITNALTGLPAAGSAAQNDTQVGLYIGNVTDLPGTSMDLVALTNCFTPGRFSGGTRTLSGWTGTVRLQVRAWLASTVYPSYEAAMAGMLGGDFSVVAGACDPFTFTLADLPAPPSSIATGGLSPIVLANYTPVPEPSSLVLSLLGLGALLLSSARKSRH